MLKSAEIVSVAKGKVAHENFLTDNICKKANKLTVWEELVKCTKIQSDKEAFV